MVNSGSPPPFPNDEPLMIPVSDRAAYLARVHYGVMGPLLMVALIAFSCRFYVRVRPVWRVGWDDWLIALGFLWSIADFAMLSFETLPTPRLLSLETATEAVKLAYLAIPVWVIAMTCIKISVSLTLLERFHPVSYTTRWWRPLLFVIIAVQLLFFAANMVYNFSKCRPLVSAWDFSNPSAICYPERTDFIFSITGSVINVMTDVALSLSPLLAVLLRLPRPPLERLLVCCLTGIGLLASSASLAKAVVVAQWDPEKPQELDLWAMAVSIATWTVAEQFIAVFGACSPSLKRPIERMLGRYGIQLSSSKTQVRDIAQIENLGGGSSSGDLNGEPGWDRIRRAPPVMFTPTERGDSAEDESGAEKTVSGV
ncbi:hypothetical protein QBC47DRAFT_79381 [Echria macrotheca]|uniref:Rhodopsin domain-containing protein n=1 Tax=Echria macrotheca TaxID=438768 RepID=A0AAJ0B5I1_9PEZI|nr:hypothetical protein QBC47DRAFT_79381 [Echria macrotheca]